VRLPRVGTGRRVRATDPAPGSLSSLMPPWRLGRLNTAQRRDRSSWDSEWRQGWPRTGSFVFASLAGEVPGPAPPCRGATQRQLGYRDSKPLSVLYDSGHQPGCSPDVIGEACSWIIPPGTLPPHRRHSLRCRPRGVRAPPGHLQFGGLYRDLRISERPDELVSCTGRVANNYNDVI
jgi:hypothetical protein